MKYRLRRALTLTLALLMLAGCGAAPVAAAPGAAGTALAAPEYPSEGGGKAPASAQRALAAFMAKANPLLLEDGKNSVYSPLSLYYALAMVTECAAGDTRSELLKALEIPEGEDWGNTMRQFFDALWFDNKVGRLLLANSLWLSDEVNFEQDTLDRLAKNYYAYSYGADMSDADGTAGRIAGWIQENTKGQLGKDVSSFQSSPDELARIINTVYFYGAWSPQFERGATRRGDFTTASGDTVEARYMHDMHQSYFADREGYTAASLSFGNNGRMCFVLPDKGVSLADIISDSETLAAALTFADRYGSDDTVDLGMVNWAVPKFNISASMQLIDTLETLGIKLAFDPDAADLSALSSTPAYISEVRQDACIKIDEDGCEAAAFTQASASAAGALP